MTDLTRIVLVGTTHPGNIGAVARAMKNMALDRLCLVDPRHFPSADATARASGADDLLAAAQVCATLDDAIADCTLVIGASTRPRTIACPSLTPRQCAELIAAARPDAQAALVFGREHSGLSNDEIDRCHYQLHIPANPAFPSLNLAAAVQIVAWELYELRMAGGEAPPGPDADDPDSGPVSLDEMERFYRHLEGVLVEIGFLDPANPRHLMRRLRRLYNRVHPDRNEINILRGMLKAIEDYAATLRRRGS